MERILSNPNLDFLYKSIMFAILTKKAKNGSVTCPEIVKCFEGEHYIEYHVEYDVQYLLNKFQNWGLIEIDLNSEIQLNNLESECETKDKRMHCEESISSMTRAKTSLSPEESQTRRKAASELLQRAKTKI